MWRTKSLLDEGERRGWNLAWNSTLKKKKKLRKAFHPITSEQTEGEKEEAGIDFIFLGSKITVESECSHEIKRHLFLGKKAMRDLDSVLKSRDITLPTEVYIVKAIVFSVVVYRHESWFINKAEHKRTDAFELWFGEDSWEFLGHQGDQASQS